MLIKSGLNGQFIFKTGDSAYCDLHILRERI